MSLTTEHRKAFLTYRKAGCVCGVVIDAVSRKDAAQRLAEHMRHPSAAQRIADAPEEHKTCPIEVWNDRWGVCTKHSVYVDMDAATPGHQEELALELSK